VLFEDTSYPDGYSPPLNVAQRYVIMCREDKKKWLLVIACRCFYRLLLQSCMHKMTVMVEGPVSPGSHVMKTSSKTSLKLEQVFC